MKRWWALTGHLAFWLTWPCSRLYLSGSKRARILVLSGNRLVVTKAWLSSGKWTLPGGGLHKGEDSVAAVLRELYEETGLRLQPSQLQRHSEQVFSYNGLRFNYVLFVSIVKRRTALRSQPLEITDVQWVDRRDLSPSNTQPDVLMALDAWWG